MYCPFILDGWSNGVTNMIYTAVHGLGISVEIVNSSACIGVYVSVVAGSSRSTVSIVPPSDKRTASAIHEDMFKPG